MKTKNVRRNIHPLPEKTLFYEQNLIFNHEMVLRVGEGFCDCDISKLFCTLLSNFTNGFLTLKIKSDTSLPPFCAALGVIAPKPPLDEWVYCIHANELGVALEARNMQGLRYAWYSFLQLLERVGEAETVGFSVPYCDIFDRPAMKFRGIHICLFPESPIELIEKTLILAAFAKFNYVVFESFGGLDMDTIHGWKDKSYSKEVIAPILKKAKLMGLEIIPMINSLGHATFSCDIIGKNMTVECNPHLLTYLEPYEYDWCISNPATAKLLKTMREEMYELCGEGEYFHIGGDESYFLATCDRCSSQPFIPMVTEYLNNLCTEICAEGRRPLIWSDMLLNGQDWKIESDESLYANSTLERPTHLILPNLDRRFIIADWQYDLVHGKEETSLHFKNQGFNTILCPWKRAGNVETLTLKAKENEIDGVMLTTWHKLQEIFPKIISHASLLWNSGQPSFFQPTIITTNLCRKLCPSNGEFLKSGWCNDRSLIE